MLKIYQAAEKHLAFLIFCTFLSVLAGSWATWYLQAHYRAEAIILGNPTDLPSLPKQIKSLKMSLGLDFSLEELESKIQLIKNPEESLIRIVSLSRHPLLSRDIVNGLATLSVKTNQTERRLQKQQEMENLKEQLRLTESHYERQLREIEELKKNQAQFELNSDLNFIEQIRFQSQKAASHYESLLAEYQSLKRDIEGIPSVIEVPAVTLPPPADPLQEKLLEIRMNLAEAEAEHGPGNPRIDILKNQLQILLEEKERAEKKQAALSSPQYKSNPAKENLEIELLRLESRVRAAQKGNQEWAERVALREKELEQLPASQSAFSKLQQGKQSTEERLRMLSQALDSVQYSDTHGKEGMKVYQLSEKASPLSESWWVKALPLLGLLMGISIGFCLASLIENSKK